MSKINHLRPELKLKDNARREMSRRIAQIRMDESNPADVPKIFKPLASSTAAFNSLCRAMKAFTEYLDDPQEPFRMVPPAGATSVREAFREFGEAKMINRYDRKYTVHDWLRSAVANPATTNPIYEWLLQNVEASQP